MRLRRGAGTPGLDGMDKRRFQAHLDHHLERLVLSENVQAMNPDWAPFMKDPKSDAPAGSARKVGKRDGVVTLPNRGVTNPRRLIHQAAAAASRHVCIADALKARCVLAEVRWRWT